MKKLLLILLFGITGAAGVLSQDIIEEAYFHELKGLEDSTGVTHLFYRHYYEFDQQCSYTDYQGEEVTYTVSLSRNNIRHYNTALQFDTLRYREGEFMWPECMTTYRKVYNYEFYKNDPHKVFQVYSSDAHWYGPSVSDWRGNSIDPGWGSPHVIGIDAIKNKILIPTWPSEVIVKRKLDESNTKVTYSANLDGSNWDAFDLYSELPDSLVFDFSLQAINPNENNEYLVIRDDSLFRSLNHGDSLEFVYKDDIFTGVSAEVLFPEDSNTYYFVYKNNVNPPLTKSIWKLTLNENAWSFIPIEFDGEMSAVYLDNSDTDKLYIGIDSLVFTSINQAESLELFLELKHNITGLYKKPDSEILYVLTTEELLEVNTENKQTITLKEIPVSNEPEPSDIPNKITLEQNYPNPFNPSTVISYQLAENSLVRLEVFDVTGRKVAVLVDGERKSAGNHRVHFEGSGLSSGVYFYRLETDGRTLTQKMLLVK